MTDPIHITAGVERRSAPHADDGRSLESLPIAFFMLDIDGGIHQANPAAAALLGWRPDWLRDQRFHRWLVSDHVERFDRHLQQTFGAPGKVMREIVRIKTRDGRLEDICLQSIACGDDRGYCRTVAMDVTDRERAERKARLLQRELAHIARVNSMGEFAGRLAHELNQPLGAVVLYCRTALKLADATADDPGRLAAALERAIESAEQASETLRHLSRFLRKHTGDREVVRLDHLVAEAARIMQATAEDQECTVDLELSGPAAWARVDRIQIEQVLINLMQNSIEAMVGAGNLPRRLVVSTRVCRDGQVSISVRDTGPGMTAAMQERVFEPFFTTKSGGLGLGLSISQSIIEAHSGRLTVESENLSGTTFILRIPGAAAS